MPDIPPKHTHVKEVIIIYGDDMSYAQIPSTELEFFESIKDVKVVFDVGSRDDTDYIRLRPDIEIHCFEPNKDFFDKLKEQIGDRPNTYLNNFGLGDKEKIEFYNNGRQGFIDGDEIWPADGPEYQIKTLDQYVDQNNIKMIDFLKIDTEGYDLKVIKGGYHTIKDKVRYLQYEHWNNKEQFHEILEKDWYMTYIGGRNVFCKKK